MNYTVEGKIRIEVQTRYGTFRLYDRVDSKDYQVFKIRTLEGGQTFLRFSGSSKSIGKDDAYDDRQWKTVLWIPTEVIHSIAVQEMQPIDDVEKNEKPLEREDKIVRVPISGEEEYVPLMADDG